MAIPHDGLSATPTPTPDPSPPNAIRVGTRSSKLALIQANGIANSLTATHPHLSFPVSTTIVSGDADKASSFAKLSAHVAGTSSADAAKNLWAKEIEDQLLANHVDLIVHCLKDMPTVLPNGCELGAIIERDDPSDALVAKPNSAYKSLDDLPPGSVVGTSSIRRKAQLMHFYPHLAVKECRGNVDTRLSKLDSPSSPYTCIILASAGLNRMNLTHRITARLTAPLFLHAVGQGALGLEVRAGDKSTLSLVRSVEHLPTRYRGLAERSLLRKLQGGCSAPIGVNTFFQQDSATHEKVEENAREEEGPILTLVGSVTHPNGGMEIRASASKSVNSDTSAEELGFHVAEKMLVSGADGLLAEIKHHELKAIEQ
ncbi:hypothetical protein MMC12_005729 [Toensbergia leucococca]|nr:hypothetical protein [Toensbergia leucococca]